jgi:hypothetical protein
VRVGSTPYLFLIVSAGTSIRTYRTTYVRMGSAPVV